MANADDEEDDFNSSGREQILNDEDLEKDDVNNDFNNPKYFSNGDD